MLLACGGGDPSPDAPDTDEQTDTDDDTDTDEGPSATDTGPPPTAREYCATTADAFCGYYVRCGRMAVNGVAECQEAFLEACSAVYQPHYIALEDAGLLELSVDGVDACAAHLETVQCDQQIFDLDGGCADVWRGLAPAGSPCGPGIDSFVCDDASTCVLDLSFCGTCEATVPVGASCEDARCEATASCVSGTCVARALPGEACGADQPCVLGASCSGGICAAPTIVGVGDACGASHRCPYKSACIGGQCVEAGLQGEVCGAQQPCASGWCDDGVCAPFREAGDPCDAGGECVSGVCDGVCADLPGACLD